MKRRIWMCIEGVAIIIVILLLENLTNIFSPLLNHQWLLKIQKNEIIYILLPIVTLVLSLYYSRVQKAKNDYGSMVYVRMIERKIIKLSLADVYMIALMYASLAVFTLVVSKLIFDALFLICSAIVAVVISVAFYYINQNIIQLYLPSMVEEYIASVTKEESTFNNDIIYSLVENCVINRKIEELNQILEAFFKIIRISLDKNKGMINSQEYIRDNIVELYIIMLEITIIINRNQSVSSSVKSEKYIIKCLNESYKRDNITMYELMIKETMSKFYFTKSYKQENEDNLFAAHVVIGSADYIIEKTCSKTWIEKSIQSLSEIVRVKAFASKSNDTEVILVSLHYIILSDNLRKYANDADIKQLVQTYFLYVLDFAQNERELSVYFPVTRQILDGLIKDAKNDIIHLFVDEFREFILNANISNNQILRDNLLILKKLRNEFSEVVGSDYIRILLNEMLIEKARIIENEQSNAMYIDMFLDILVNDDNIDKYNSTFRSLFIDLSRKDGALCSYVFSFYVKKFIDNIDNHTEFDGYIKVIGEYLSNGAREFEDKLFYTAVNTFFAEYKEFLIDNPKTCHEYKKVIIMIKGMLLETIDINNNDRYIYVIKRLKSLVEETSKFKTKSIVKFVFEILRSISKYSLERHYIDIVKSSSNELSWYVKNQFSDEYTDCLEEGVKAIIDLFNISIHLDPNSNIIPSFIGTAFILLGSIDYEEKDKPSRNAILINNAMRDIYSEEVYKILQISYNLRLNGNSFLGSGFNDESITNYFNSFKKHVAKK